MFFAGGTKQTMHPKVSCGCMAVSYQTPLGMTGEGKVQYPRAHARFTRNSPWPQRENVNDQEAREAHATPANAAAFAWRDISRALLGPLPCGLN